MTTIPGPLDLITDHELLEELCRRARSGPQRAFVGMYMRPDEGQPLSSGWLICAGEQGDAVRSVILMLIQRLGIGLPVDYQWLWELLVPTYTLTPHIAVHPPVNPKLHASLISMRQRTLVDDDPQFLLTVDQIMRQVQLVRQPSAEGWEYVNAADEPMIKLARSTCFSITSRVAKGGG